MTDIQETLVAALNPVASNRVYPGKLPASPTLPALTYTLVDSQPVDSHSGASGLARSRFQVTAWAKTYSAAVALAETARLAVLALGPVRALGALDRVDDETGWYYRPADYAIWHSEAVPA